jgi:hypothetical protein
MDRRTALAALAMLLVAGLLALVIDGPAGATALLEGVADVLSPW